MQGGSGTAFLVQGVFKEGPLPTVGPGMSGGLISEIGAYFIFSHGRRFARSYTKYLHLRERNLLPSSLSTQ